MRRRPKYTPTAFCRGRRRRCGLGQPDELAVSAPTAVGEMPERPTATVGVQQTVGISRIMLGFITTPTVLPSTQARGFFYGRHFMPPSAQVQDFFKIFHLFITLNYV